MVQWQMTSLERIPIISKPEVRELCDRLISILNSGAIITLVNQIVHALVKRAAVQILGFFQEKIISHRLES